MKFLLPYIVLFSIVLQLSSNVATIVNYMANKEFISKNLCENKSKPKMHCNGKCHLMKQLQKQNKKSGNPLSSEKEKLELQFFKDKTSYTFSNYSVNTSGKFIYLLGKTNSFNSFVFHPPSC